ncbi:extracellular solute-binding protein family 1 [Catenulispora acidiphila DSM 44928]|uniref:Extracellular solute-binding protein family 1 n=1 Tax=Catenulispora acidiphila (strain DSM 44928 / JCM 14897 / NBRC 102108 / NRRL B-24433 / ID139908) TaxID=479433 RepID=C7Q9S8_CATAD|nr:iron ABC transporter substrate-binding protein [Catenulispora acidiphila]ACU76247.1 extracellular solute-binding protein family 1 [Catenulispora acidiphila DSM 44928]
MRAIRRPVIALTAVAACLVGVAGCGSSASKASAGGTSSGQSITVYSGQHEQTVKALVADFEKRTGVKVELRSGDEAELANQLLQEGSASPADVFYAENPPALTMLDEKGLLAPVAPDALKAVPAADSSPKGDWLGVSARAAAFIAATGSAADTAPPTSLRDLAKPEWKGRLGIAPSETDFAPVITRMIAADGVEATKAWLVGLKANAKTYDSNEDLSAAVNAGEVQGGVIDHYYWFRLRDEKGAADTHSKLHYFAKGDPGALVDVSGAAVLKNGKHQQAAQAFLAYLVSAPAQQLIATSESYEYPLVAGIAAKDGLAPLDSIGTVADVAQLGDGKQALQLLQDTGLLQ